MLSMSSIAKEEKNKLFTDSAFVILLELVVPIDDVDPIYVCYNNEDINWNGHVWQGFPFEVGEVTEDSSGAVPSFDINIDNSSQALTYYVEQSKGARNGEVIIRVVNTKALDLPSCELEEHYSVNDCNMNDNKVIVNVGTSYAPGTRRPIDKYLKNNCRFKTFKGPECACTNNNFTTCNRTLTACRERGNSKRFGGFSGIDQGGIYV